MTKSKTELKRRISFLVCIILVLTCVHVYASGEKIDKLLFVTDNEGMSDLLLLDIDYKF